MPPTDSPLSPRAVWSRLPGRSAEADPAEPGASVSVVIEARSREQLDAIYDDLTTHDKVLMRL